MVYERPNPDDVLKAISKEHKKNGKLKIFFGYAAGVGKTFAMLEAAHKSKESGIDVVAGYIEPHTRVETLNLLNGLEMLPNLKVDYKGISLNEFNIDGALERKPDLILVDELAHSNAVGCRHVKRYQDIKELLDNGIDVYTTVNVQHIESLNDIVASITGIIVKERIPDSVFDNADQIELVDIEPEDLIQRLNEGKIYRTDQAKRALLNFFTKEKLVALREIALRRTADAVNKKIDIERERTKNSYYTEEHLLICLSSSPSNAKVIRTAARMADAFHGLFTALFVETTDTKEFQDENRVRLERNLKLAEQLGARIATVYGDDIAWQISEYAKLSGVSKIVLGRSTTKKGLFKTKKTLVDKLTEIAPNIDIYIIPDNSK
ncbi:histidine kinase, partial [Gordonibacter pamelaeae]|nr:histidine kinase [Gordonibacter pamelaeae]